MTPAFSVYLDLVRATAALLVLFYHASNDEFGGLWLKRAFSHTGTPGVIIFFVLSGFVISWTAATKERDFKVFIINRLARLWSVAIPALVVTYFADKVGFAIYPQIYSAIDDWTALLAHPFSHLAMSGVFLNQIWFLDIRPLSNNPFWSLCYEWWYYAAFGFFMLIRGRAGSLLSLAAFAVMGPKIWLLFPIWLMGVAVHRQLQVRRRLPVVAAVPLFLAPLGVVGVFALYQVLHLREFVEGAIDPHYLAFSIIFIPATLFGALMALNLYAFPSLERYFAAALSKIERPVRWVAGATLSIYLYHYPLLYLFGALFRVEPTSPFWKNLAIVVCTLGCCFALSAFTESKKRTVRGWLETLWLMMVRLRQSQAAISAPVPRSASGSSIVSDRTVATARAGIEKS
jgi:peptidoglycan/LPS O-acetylase OafA/YrhL